MICAECMGGDWSLSQIKNFRSHVLRIIAVGRAVYYCGRARSCRKMCCDLSHVLILILAIVNLQCISRTTSRFTHTLSGIVNSTHLLSPTKSTRVTKRFRTKRSLNLNSQTKNRRRDMSEPSAILESLCGRM